MIDLIYVVNFLTFQNQELLREIENLKKGFNVDVVAQALREVKEYAARSCEINVDTLQLKLMHLDEVARRVNDTNRELYSMVLQRFLCHKNHDKIGFLVTSLLSTPAETKIYEKEQKFLKVHGSEKAKDQESIASPDKKTPEYDGQMQQFMHMLQMAQSVVNPARLSQGFSSYRYPAPSRRGSVTPRKLPPNYAGCYKCGDTTHFRVDCPKK